MTELVFGTSTGISRFPDATEEELRELDNTCIICRDQLLTGKKLPCNHVFHSHCLRSWFQRQQSCPTCRLDVLSNQQQSQAQARARPPPPQPPQPPHPQIPQQPGMQNFNRGLYFYQESACGNGLDIASQPFGTFCAI